METTAKSSQLYVKVPIVEWQGLIYDIKAAGISFVKQAEYVGVGYSTFQKWTYGAHPRYSWGSALLELHTIICGSEKTSARIKT